MKLYTIALLLLALATGPSAPARDRLPSRRRLLECGQPMESCCCAPMLGKRVERALQLPPPHLPLVHQSVHAAFQLAGIPSYQQCCRNASLFCQTFSFVEPGIPGACPQPSLCLPVPEVRGARPTSLP